MISKSHLTSAAGATFGDNQEAEPMITTLSKEDVLSEVLPKITSAIFPRLFYSFLFPPFVNEVLRFTLYDNVLSSLCCCSHPELVVSQIYVILGNEPSSNQGTAISRETDT